uniref:Zf-CCHC_6 domain-containing protein n=1 Tax=Glossina pallidipes TaxID=7398 RepID=A0A1B0A591_GLOPL
MVTDLATGEVKTQKGLPVKCANCNTVGHVASDKKCPVRLQFANKPKKQPPQVATSTVVSGVSFSDCFRPKNQPCVSAASNAVKAFESLDVEYEKHFGKDFLSCLQLVVNFKEKYNKIQDKEDKTRSLFERRNARSVTIAVSLDIAKAFNAAWKNGIVHKLHSCGFDKRLCGLIKEYFHERAFYVKVNKSTSLVKKVNADDDQKCPPVKNSKNRKDDQKCPPVENLKNQNDEGVEMTNIEIQNDDQKCPPVENLKNQNDDQKCPLMLREIKTACPLQMNQQDGGAEDDNITLQRAPNKKKRPLTHQKLGKLYVEKIADNSRVNTEN